MVSSTSVFVIDEDSPRPFSCWASSTRELQIREQRDGIARDHYINHVVRGQTFSRGRDSILASLTRSLRFLRGFMNAFHRFMRILLPSPRPDAS